MRCLLLDMGKVLLDFDWKRFHERMRAATGVESDILPRAFAGDGVARKYESGFLTDEAFHAALCEAIGAEVDMRYFVRAWNSIFAPTPILPDSLVQSLAQRADLWVVSNTNNLHFAYVMDHFPVFRHFKGFVLSYEVKAMKPDPKIFSEALSRAGVMPSQALFVDDQLANVLAARDLGIDAFQFVNPDHFIAELQKRDIL